MNFLKNDLPTFFQTWDFCYIIPTGGWIFGLPCSTTAIRDFLFSNDCIVAPKFKYERMKVQISTWWTTWYQYHIVLVYFVITFPSSYFVTVKPWCFVLQSPCSPSWKPVATLCFSVLALCCSERLNLTFRF